MESLKLKAELNKNHENIKISFENYDYENLRIQNEL